MVDKGHQLLTKEFAGTLETRPDKLHAASPACPPRAFRPRERKNLIAQVLSTKAID